MYRLDFTLSDKNKTPYVVQYKEPLQGVVVFKSTTNKFFIKLASDLHFEIANARFNNPNLNPDFGIVDFKTKPKIFKVQLNAENQLINLHKTIYQFYCNEHGAENIFSDRAFKPEMFDISEFNKIFNDDSYFIEDTATRRFTDLLIKEKKEKELKAKQKKLEKFTAQLQAQFEKETKNFAKENNIPLPNRTKGKGKDKLLWRFG
jgi:hypothetical protein